MTNATSLLSQIRSLEEQLRVLYAQVQPHTVSEPEGAHTLADSEGLLHGQADSSEAAIDAILYQVPPEMDAET